MGDRPTVADVALYVYPSVAPEGGFDLRSYPALRTWLERVAALPVYVPLKPPGWEYDEDSQCVARTAKDNW